ncbi:glutathione-disulfide reductase [Porticoccus sp. Uisw_050_02]|jgi:glutathione reductase (NADPH)|uniref:glutathione-disulfide reductase n=1 Tax=Porticoccus sp. Uisw_050_02 TaxID=3230978 RepID=UPI0039E836C0|tara:strand:+ start:3202 stop:4554 length:1353 start_codon:yes stop_codon:yes gene_type:complete
MKYDFDLFVIGAGSGGVRTARMSASKGLKVGIAEYQALGGTCVNVGCIPKKLFVYASEYSHIFDQAEGFGWSIAKTEFNWDILRENKNKEIERLNKIYNNLLDHVGVKVIRGRASILDPHSVKVGNNVYTAKNILIATGGTPYIPEFPGSKLVVTSNEAFYLKELPRKIIIVGGGYIAVEFAGIFKGLGVETHLVYRGPLFLKGFDSDVRNKIKEEYENQGVVLHFSTDVEEVKKINSGYCVRLSTKEEIDVDLVMYATGRIPNIKDLGLESLNIKTKSNGTIIVDDYFNTSEPSIYALGDVIGRIELTPVAIAEGMALSNFFVTGMRSSVDYTNIPTAIFSQPNSASVGLTEEEAIKIHGIDLRIYKSQFRPMKATLGGGDSKVFMKLIVIHSSDVVIGCHMVGDYAGEIIQGLAVAIKAGATKQNFDSTVGIHPTAAEEFVTMRQPVD